MDIIPKVGVTGLPGVGKTEVLIRVMERLKNDYIFGGMITKSIIENKKRVGFKIVDWFTEEERLFAHINMDSSYRVGKYKIDLKVLEEFGIPAIRKAVDDDTIDIVVIDEVGKMELESRKFRDIVKDALDCEKPVLLTLYKKSRDALLQDIRNRNNVRIFEITPKNRNILPYKIEKILKEGL
jgi:nucleoside-triphosphatase